MGNLISSDARIGNTSGAPAVPAHQNLLGGVTCEALFCCKWRMASRRMCTAACESVTMSP
jgi:hypothetical protein